MSKTKERVREGQLRAKHSLGQHFLYDEGLLAALADAAEIGPEDDVLEIGPGSGSLTKPLCERARRVLAVELDARMIPLLTAFMEPYGQRFTLVEGDVMRLNLAELTASLRKPFSVVANIPYYITTPLITRLLTAGLPLRRLALMVQKEVAEKLLAAPGEDGWGMLALRCQYFCEPRLALEVPARCFTPPPKVDSAFVVMPVRETPPVAVRSEDALFRVAQAGFALRRKTMLNALIAAFRLERAQAEALLGAAGVDPRARGETLTLPELARLADAYAALAEGEGA